MADSGLNTRLPLALLYSPEGGKLAKIGSELACDEFQIDTINKVTVLADYSLQAAELLRVCVVDLTASNTDFKTCFEAVDMGFRDASGPVVAVVDNITEEEEAVLLKQGAAKVVDIGLGAKSLQLVLSLEIREFTRISQLKVELLRRSSAIGQIVSGVFKFKTRREAQNLATMLSMTCPNPMPIAVGLTELLINGVEHGCLSIGHDEKGALIEDGLLAEEILKRRMMPKYENRFVTVDFLREPNRLCFTIRDGGEGFDFEPYVEASDGHAKKHGRGIMMAKGCFERLEYRGCGNEVYAVHTFGEPSEDD